MAHYAFLDDNNIVTEVITGVDETELLEGKTPEQWYGEFRGQKCLRSSYNAAIRKNFAGIGFTYDESLDAFIPPKPFESWILNQESCIWEPPTPCPGDSFTHQWDEKLLSWVQTTE